MGNLIALCLTLFEAYKARHIKTVLGETIYVSMAAGSMSLVVAMGVPIAIIANENPTALFFVNLFIIFITCISLLFFIFYPKVKYHFSLVRGENSMKAVVKDFAEQAHAHHAKSKKRKISHTAELSELVDDSHTKVKKEIMEEATKYKNSFDQEDKSVRFKYESQNEMEMLNQENEYLKQQLERQKSQVEELQRLLNAKSNEKDEFRDESY